MQPYQEAAEKQRSLGETGIGIGKNIALSAIGGGTAKSGYHLAGKIIPKVAAFLSKYIPDKLSQAGLSALDPRMDTFINGALDEGYNYDEVKEFLGDKIEKSEIKKDDKNVIEKESQELHQFIIEEIKKGKKPIEAAALATLDRSKGPNFNKVIKKLQDTHKKGWGKIVEDLYGNGVSSLTNRPPATESKSFTQQPQPIQQQPNPNSSQGQQLGSQQQGGNNKWNQIASTLQNLLNS